MSTKTGDPAAPATTDSTLARRILSRVCSDMGMMLDREMPMGELVTERATARPAGENGVHISFKLGFNCRASGRRKYGAILVPLEDAIAMAGFLTMTPDATIESNRRLRAPDDSAKDAMMELSNLIGGGVDGVLRETQCGDWNSRSLGCQGVRPGVRPAFPYVEGDELVVSRMETQVGAFKSFTLLLILPVLELG